MRISGIALVLLLHGWLLVSLAALITPAAATAINKSPTAIAIQFTSAKVPAKPVVTKPAAITSLATGKHYLDKPKKSASSNHQQARHQLQPKPRKTATHNSKSHYRHIVNSSTAESATHNSASSAKIARVNSAITKKPDELPIITTPLFAQPPVPPRYPTIARKRGQQGTVWLEIWLDKNGQQAKLVVAQSSGLTALDQAAIAAVRKWHFSAYKVGNSYQAARVRIPVEFSLN